MKFKERFSVQDLEKVKAAVKAAEQKISGEIIPVFVERSDPYKITQYKSGALLAAFVFLLIIFFDRYVPALAVYDPMYIFVIVLISGLLGAFIPEISDVYKRALLHASTMEHASFQKAETMFLEEEVFYTRQRTGIMIFISFFEHEVIVMADRGISKVVEQKVWDKVVTNLVKAIKKDNAVDGTINAIQECTEILLKHGFQRTTDDINELSDNLRIE
ncbi:MAG TPA: hypothetical protein PKC24_05840 [Cyclobacteriaceae bacterium]|nr:hypothetical protein [Cyclobacteriaceae bacterium]